MSSMMTLSSFISCSHKPPNCGSSQLSSSATLISTLDPYFSFVMSLKQSSLVSMDTFMRIMFGIGLVIVISLSSTSDGEHIVGSQGGASMKSSSDIPSMHRKCSNIGSNGLRKIGRRQDSLALSITSALYKEIFSVILEYISDSIAMAWSVKSAYRVRAVSTFGLNSGGVAVIISQGAKFLRSHTGNVCAVVVIAFTAAPNGMIGLLHPGWERSDEVRRLIEVPGTVTSGSLNIRAVAGMVLGTTNPELAPSVELNTDMTTAPGNPAAKRDNSAATAAFYNGVVKIKYSSTQFDGVFF